MAKPILVLLALLLASPALAQETLPLRSVLGEVEITATDGGGGYIVGASILLSGPTQREALSLAHGAEFEELPPGRYQVTVRMADSSEIRHTMTIVGGVRYEALWKVGASPLPIPAVGPPMSTLGPLSISDVKVESKRDVTYVTSNRSHALMYRRVEIRRLYADGSSRVDIQQDDSFDRNALSSLRNAAFYLNDAGWSPAVTSKNLHPARFTSRTDPPVSVQVRIVAVATADGVMLGDARVLHALIERRQRLVEELEYWIGRFETRMREGGGVLLSDLLAEELTSPRQGERTEDYRLALLRGLQNIRIGGWDDLVANRVVLNQLKVMI